MGLCWANIFNKTGQKTLLFDATNARASYPLTRPLEEQEERESQRLWAKVTEAIKKKDQNVATDEKSRIEDEQRREASERAEQDIEWRPTLFRPVRGGPGGEDEEQEDLDFVINTKM